MSTCPLPPRVSYYINSLMDVNMRVLHALYHIKSAEACTCKCNAYTTMKRLIQFSTLSRICLRLKSLVSFMRVNYTHRSFVLFSCDVKTDVPGHVSIVLFIICCFYDNHNLLYLTILLVCLITCCLSYPAILIPYMYDYYPPIFNEEKNPQTTKRLI